jgi:hypothetical protein
MVAPKKSSGNPYLGIVDLPLSINADDASAWGATEGASDTNDPGTSKTPGHGPDAHGAPDESPVQRLQRRYVEGMKPWRGVLR